MGLFQTLAHYLGVGFLVFVVHFEIMDLSVSLVRLTGLGFLGILTH